MTMCSHNKSTYQQQRMPTINDINTNKVSMHCKTGTYNIYSHLNSINVMRSKNKPFTITANMDLISNPTLQIGKRERKFTQ